MHFEHLIDRFCLDHAFTRLCAFDAAALGADLLGELGCVHTLTHGELSPFQLCAARQADAALVGSVDAFSIAQLLEALRRIGVPRPGGQAVLDATDLEFIDVRALRELDRHAADAGATLVLRSAPYSVLRLMELLGVRAVRAEQTGRRRDDGAVPIRGAPRRLPSPVPVCRARRWGLGVVARQPGCGQGDGAPRKPPPSIVGPGGEGGRGR